MSEDNTRSASSRRKFLAANLAVVNGAVAGCLGDDATGQNSGSDSSDDETGESTTSGTDGSDSSDETTEATTYEVGYGDYQTTVSEADFPDGELVAYAVQTGWSNWGAVMEAFQDEYGITLDDNQGSSGEKLEHARSNAQNPQSSVFNGGYSFAIQAMNDDLTTDYKPANWDKVPDDLKTDNGHCVATRQMTTAVTYRADIYEERGVEPPETWEDLKDPAIAQDLAFTPPHTANGLASALSVNNAYGGSMDNLDPLIEYHEAIADEGADFRRNVEGDFTSGEISTVVEYDYTGLNLKYNIEDLDEDQVDIAIVTGPDGEPGALNVPYGFALMRDAPNPETAKLFMDFVLELDAQALFFDAFVRPIRASELDAPDEFPDQSAYDAAQFTVNQEDLVANQEAIIEEITERTPLQGAQ